tara:strand:+ start:362 stop:499 length:138 start_codon:yes stop_codon:yes gene_type:complete
MENGLAHQVVYGTGEDQTIKHKYAGSNPNKKRKKCKKLHKARKKL